MGVILVKRAALFIWSRMKIENAKGFLNGPNSFIDMAYRSVDGKFGKKEEKQTQIKW